MSVEKLAADTKPTTWRGQAVQLLAIVLLVLVAKGAVAEQFYVPSPSMEPTLLTGDMLLASKYPYGYGAASLPIHVALPETGRIFGAMPKRGDVVVFRWPGDRSPVWVKRVVGLPGDRILMRQGQLFINDHPA
ncbi:signal peptidase I, partial [Tardiphaga sp.]|uniref:signal peptidase I n=1 Tax=Tardiphaga sp. TaxID=1926292 RepID=UPI00261F68E5